MGLYLRRLLGRNPVVVVVNKLDPETKDAEIARLTSELQLAWNTCEEAETNARRLQAENKQLRAVADAAHSYVYSFEAGSLSFEESSFRTLEEELAALKETTEGVGAQSS